MKIKSAFLISIFYPLIANGMTCQQEESLKSKYDNADSVLLIEIISAKSDYQKVENENVRLNVATYELVESFKGSKTKRGKVTEILGYGAGMVGLLPGMYYVVFLGNDTTQLKYPWVNMCNTSYSAFDYTSGGFKEHLDEIRSLE
ncbi:MAG: hypothetical protein N0C84_13190 [Candidatus Thiodiazotropha taylori]|uniref:Uncharacterized protein n=1 Tax=Candidatus Thiodiazotropha taylori TaxID=2792791 RepID=A0A9E4KE89_9GAMM|nr:hypothetical protein [Candidatus Thiodiazotropha sp. (ex Codakia orbicularis)]MBV2123907.1 hypothetical protein [Candidatus Thiodiazotropha taylori]MCG7947291.1 hypothetical protein [Candidatus Thiodiazotropha taylori]MCW4257412.1 hypothetical protein [Candidatus Thiodiazotropha taylori]